MSNWMVIHPERIPGCAQGTSMLDLCRAELAEFHFLSDWNGSAVTIGTCTLSVPVTIGRITCGCSWHFISYCPSLLQVDDMCGQLGTSFHIYQVCHRRWQMSRILIRKGLRTGVNPSNCCGKWHPITKSSHPMDHLPKRECTPRVFARNGP